MDGCYVNVPAYSFCTEADEDNIECDTELNAGALAFTFLTTVSSIYKDRFFID